MVGAWNDVCHGTVAGMNHVEGRPLSHVPYFIATVAVSHVILFIQQLLYSNLYSYSLQYIGILLSYLNQLPRVLYILVPDIILYICDIICKNLPY